MSKLACAFAASILCVSLFTLIVVAAAESTSFIVQPQKEHAVTLGLRETDSVSGSFSVVSDDGSGITFYVSDPQGRTILGFDNISQKNFSFTAQATGNYQLHFENSASTVYSKTVALNYSITRYIMGLPQEQFLFVVIAIVAIVGLLAYIVLMPK